MALFLNFTLKTLFNLIPNSKPLLLDEESASTVIPLSIRQASFFQFSPRIRFFKPVKINKIRKRFSLLTLSL